MVDGALVAHCATTVPEAPAIEIACVPVTTAAAASLAVGPEDLGPPSIRLGDPTWRWQWQPRGRVGAFAVRLTVKRCDGEHMVRDLRLVVEPAKLPHAAYEALLADIQRISYALVYALGGGMAPASARATPESTTVLADYWTRLAHLGTLATSITRSLASRPNPNMRRLVEERPLSEVTEIDAAMLARLPSRPLDEGPALPVPAALPLGRGGRQLLPRTLPVGRTEMTAVTYEHSLLASILRQLSWRCRFVREELRRELVWREMSNADDASAASLQALRDWDARVAVVIRQLEHAAASDFLAGVDRAVRFRGVTGLMRRDRRYRVIGRLWRLLEQRPFVALHSPAYELPTSDLPRLYELWCLLAVVEVLARCGSHVEQRLLVPRTAAYAGGVGTVWTVRIPEDEALMRRRLRDGTEVTLLYQRRYRPGSGQAQQLGSLDPFLRIPDIAIEITPPGQMPRAVIFDAKYRVAPAGGIPEDALADAYAYHAAIGCEGVPAVSATYLLFPGEHGFKAGAVGALPLIPGKTDPLAALISRVLDNL